MMDGVQWVETTREVYACIYQQHIGQLTVFGAISRPEDDWYGERRMLTDWGLKGANYPLIRHDDRGTPSVHTFYLAKVIGEQE